MNKEKEISGDNLSPMFSNIMRHYDLINHVFTWGMDSRWRKKLIARCLESKPQKVLDLGCGTGDLAINIARLTPESLHITACDFSLAMLAIASQKAKNAGVDKKISFVNGDAACLPFDDDYFDCICISFAFRNMIYKNPSADKHIFEIWRILKPGGSCFIVETSQPKNKIIRCLNHFYVYTYVYAIGLLISGDKQAYKYLVESAINFYAPEKLKRILSEAGFQQVDYEPLFFGAAGIYRLVK